MVAHPRHDVRFVLLLASQRRHVEIIVCIQEQIEAALIGRVGVEDTVAIPQKNTQPGRFAFIDPNLTALLQLRCVLVVILVSASGLVQSDLEVPIESIARG